MDGMSIYMFISFIGILQKSSLYYVDGIHFEAPEMVEWSKAEYICQRNHGKLFKPNETLFDVCLFSTCNFKDDVWVSATSIIIISELASTLSGNDSVIRCEMCTIGTNCGTSCSYKACGSQCRPLCEHDARTRVLYDEHMTWTEARQRCRNTFSTLGDRIQNVSSLFFYGYCSDECFWTRNRIEVKFLATTGLTDAEGQCGILQNGTLSFTGCNRKLRPLCQRLEIGASTDYPHSNAASPHLGVTMTALETLREGSTTDFLGRHKISNVTITSLSTYGASSMSNDIVERTTFELSEENSPSSEPEEGVTISRNDREGSPHKADSGIIIGSVIGSVVFLIITVFGILWLRKKLLQRTSKKKSDHDSRNITMHPTDQSS